MSVEDFLGTIIIPFGILTAIGLFAAIGYNLFIRKS